MTTQPRYATPISRGCTPIRTSQIFTTATHTTSESVERLGFIRSAKSLGLTFADIRRVLQLSDTGERPCRRVESMVAAKVMEIDQRIEELQVLRDRLCSLDTAPGRRGVRVPDHRARRLTLRASLDATVRGTRR
ncbi:MAG: hypothetical protein DHS20C19_00520 [Acidimicrobiales bacterium]|nr:MAG: hypothetical protein DHS20C19_00520 [Acidimicrobiales bacterium]